MKYYLEDPTISFAVRQYCGPQIYTGPFKAHKDFPDICVQTVEGYLADVKKYADLPAYIPAPVEKKVRFLPKEARAGYVPPKLNKKAKAATRPANRVRVSIEEDMQAVACAAYMKAMKEMGNDISKLDPQEVLQKANLSIKDWQEFKQANNLW